MDNCRDNFEDNFKDNFGDNFRGKFQDNFKDILIAEPLEMEIFSILLFTLQAVLYLFFQCM